MYAWVLKFSQSCKCQTQSTYSSFMYWYIIIGRWWKKSLKKSANHRQSSSSLFSTSGKILSSMSEPNPNPCIHLVKFRPPLSPTAASDCLPCCLRSTSSSLRHTTGIANNTQMFHKNEVFIFCASGMKMMMKTCQLANSRYSPLLVVTRKHGTCFLSYHISQHK